MHGSKLGNSTYRPMKPGTEKSRFINGLFHQCTFIMNQKSFRNETKEHVGACRQNKQGINSVHVHTLGNRPVMRRDGDKTKTQTRGNVNKNTWRELKTTTRKLSLC